MLFKMYQNKSMTRSRKGVLSSNLYDTAKEEISIKSSQRQGTVHSSKLICFFNNLEISHTFSSAYID